MATSSETPPRHLSVEPRQLLVARTGTDDDGASVQVRIRAAGVRGDHWFVVTPRQPLHPGYQPDHWLGTAEADAQPDRARDLPATVWLTVATRRLDSNRRHEAIAYVVLQLPNDDALIERVTVIVLPVGVAPAAQADQQVGAKPATRPMLSADASRPTPSTGPSLRASPLPRTTPNPSAPRAAALEAFCGRCGHRFAPQEKFCPKDGRQRQQRRR